MVFRQTPLWFASGMTTIPGGVMLLDAIGESDEERVFIAIIWLVISSTITVYDFANRKEKKKKEAFELARKEGKNKGTFSLKEKSFVSRQMDVDADYVWKLEKLEDNLFYGVWVKVVRRTKNRVIIEVSIEKRISSATSGGLLK